MTTPCDVGSHVMCCSTCDCTCHDEPAAVVIDTVVAHHTARLDTELAAWARELTA